MKDLFRLPIIAAALVIFSATAAAQGRTPRAGSGAVGGDVGWFFPTEDALNASASFDGFYEYYLQPRTSIRLGLGWTAPEYAFESDESLGYIRIGGDLIYNWEGGAIHPFVGAGVGIYILQPSEDGNDVAQSESKPGGVLLGGLEYFTSNSVSLKGEVSYHFISDVENFGPANPSGFKLAVGLKKYF